MAQLQQLNPALLRGTAPVGYNLRVPKGLAQQTDAALDKVPAGIRVSSRVHRVESGESLAAIARQYNASASAIASVNGISGSQPAEGDQLVIPAAYREVYAAVKAPRTASARKPAAKRTTTVASAKAPAKAPAVKTPVAKTGVKTAGTVAQASHKTSSLNR